MIWWFKIKTLVFMFDFQVNPVLIEKLPIAPRLLKLLKPFCHE